MTLRVSHFGVSVFVFGIPFSLALILVEETLWPIAITYLVLSVILTAADSMIALPPRALKIEAYQPETLFIGDKVEFKVTLSAKTGWPRTTAEIVCDVGSNLASPPLQRLSLVPGQDVHLSFLLVPKRRGTAEIHRLWMRWHGPLRLMLRQRIQQFSITLPVVPDIRVARYAAIHFWSRDALFGLKPDRQQGEGSEFESLRDYVPGLDHRSIDWKHSARHRKLVCKEFRAERNHQVVLAFDTGHLMSEPLGVMSKLDHAINAGLLLAYMSLRGGDRVGIFGFDSQVRTYVEPAGGVHRFGRLQRGCAELEYRHDETNFTLGLVDLLTRLNRRSLVILQTEFVDTITAELMIENLSRLSARHLVLFVTFQDLGLVSTADALPRSVDDMTKSVIASDFIHERTIVLERLRRLGVHCLHACSESVGVDLVNRYLSIKRKELL